MFLKMAMLSEWGGRWDILGFAIDQGENTKKGERFQQHWKRSPLVKVKFASPSPGPGKQP